MSDRVDMSQAEKIEFSQDASAADVAEFHNDEQREVDLQTFMQGEQHQDGGRHDLSPRGLTSANDEIRELQALEEMKAVDAMRNAQYREKDYVNPQEGGGNGQSDELSHWRKLYGDSENEKGELRRQLEQEQEYRQLLEQQMNNFANSGGQGSGLVPDFFSGQSQPQPQYQPVPQNAAPQYSPQPQQFVQAEQFDDNEYVTGSQLKSFQNQMAQAAMYLAQEQEQLRQQQVNWQRQQFEQAKASAGITPADEARLVAKNPWLRQAGSPEVYLNTLKGMIAHEKQVNAVRQPQPPQAAVPSPSQRARTFVEGQGQQPVGREQMTGGAQFAFQKEMAEINALPYGHPDKTKRMKALLQRNGVQSVSGFRDPSISTR